MLIPRVSQTTQKGERSWDVFSGLLNNRIIYLGGGVSDEMASSVVAQLLYLESEDPDRDIMLYINSQGGLVSAGLAIYDTMQYVSPAVATVCVGSAVSTASFLLTAGAPGKRYCLPHAKIMTHQPSAASEGSASDLAIHARQVLRTREVITGLMAKHTGQSPEQVMKDMQRDRFFRADEAKAYGIIDVVLSPALFSSAGRVGEGAR